MSRKQFILLAAALRVARAHIFEADESAVWVVDELIYTVAVVCRQLNKEFSFDTFYAASNYKDQDNARNTQIVNA